MQPESGAGPIAGLPPLATETVALALACLTTRPCGPARCGRRRQSGDAHAPSANRGDTS